MGRTGVRGVRLAVLVLAIAVLTGSSTTTATAPSRRRGACTDEARGTVTAHHLRSTATGRTERYQVYRPPGTEPGEALRLLVLLHGATSDDTQWLHVGLASAADCLLARGQLPPTLIVVVDGSSAEQDGHRLHPPLERLVTDELLPLVRRVNPNLAGRNGTAIGGISLGGGWALRIAAHRPDLFGAVGGHSPASLINDSDRRALARHHTRVWIDVGRNDPLRAHVGDLVDELRETGVIPTVQGWPGVHDDHYWRSHVPDYLRFYGRS